MSAEKETFLWVRNELAVMIIVFCSAKKISKSQVQSKLLMECSLRRAKPGKGETFSKSQIESFTAALSTFFTVTNKHESMFSIYQAGFLLCASENLRSSKQGGVDGGRQVPPRQLAAPTSQSSAPTNTIRQLDRTFPLVKKLARPQKSGHPIWELLRNSDYNSQKSVPLLSQQKPLKNSNRQSEPTLHRSKTCAFFSSKIWTFGLMLDQVLSELSAVRVKRGVRSLPVKTLPFRRSTLAQSAWA